MIIYHAEHIFYFYFLTILFNFSLEYFKEPVTIKCGHKFCRSCILRVTNAKNASCPVCKQEIHKRSIPKEGNNLLQACVENYQALTKAIEADIGINSK